MTTTDNHIENTLLRAGLREAQARDLTARMASSAEGTFAPAELEGATDEQIALFAAIAAATTVRESADVLRSLLAFLRGREHDLSPFDASRYWHIKGVIAWRLEDSFFAATIAFNRSLELLRKDESPESRAYLGRVFDSLGQALHHQGLLADARADFEQAVRCKEEAGDQSGLAITLGNLGRLCLEVGDFDAATGFLRRDLKFLEESSTEATALRAQLLSHLGACALGLGHLEEARSLFQESQDLAREQASAVDLAFCALGLGKVALKEGRRSKARNQLEEAVHQAQDSSVPAGLAAVLQGLAHRLGAEIHLEAGDAATAVEEFDKARSLFASAPSVSPVEMAELLHGAARARLALGQGDRAALLLREALRFLDATAFEGLRQQIEGELQAAFRESWLLHSAGRFIGQQQIELLLEEAGSAGFRGQRTEVAILFSDLRGFTSLSEGLGPEQLVTLLNEYLGRMTRCVEQFHGFVDKFIGDAVMALFSLPVAQADDAERAALAALMMQAELDRLNRGLADEGLVLRAGVGLHLGPVVAGLIGSPQKRSYTVIGDSVNTASRVEGMTKLLGTKILVTGDVVARWTEPERFLVRPLGRFSPKGRKQSVEVFDLVGERDSATLQPGLREEVARTEKALHLFHNRRFDEAKQAFLGLAKATVGKARQRGYSLLANKAASLVTSPPPPNWQGEIVLSEK